MMRFMTAVSGPPGDLSLPIVWPEDSGLPVLPVNQFAVQLVPDSSARLPRDILLTSGFIAPPLVVGETQADIIDKLLSRSSVSVEPVARLLLSPGTLEQLITLLQNTLDQINKIEAAAKGGDAE
jgi:hypothetical protein